MAELSQLAGGKMSLFHYTDVAAIQSIIEHHKIWMTDVRYLNDTEEFHGGANFVQRAIVKLKELYSDDEYMILASEFIKDVDESYFKNLLLAKPKFVCSFSQKGNLLS